MAYSNNAGVGIRAVPTCRLDSDAGSNSIRFVVVCRSTHSARTIGQWTIAAVDSIDYYYYYCFAVVRWSYPYFVQEMLVDRFVKHSVLDAVNANY